MVARPTANLPPMPRSDWDGFVAVDHADASLPGGKTAHIRAALMTIGKNPRVPTPQLGSLLHGRPRVAAVENFVKLNQLIPGANRP